MQLVNQRQIHLLDKHRNETCLSIYMPLSAHRSRKGSRRARFQKLLRIGQEKLKASGALTSRQIAAMLRPARALERDEAFWMEAEGGLAAFIAPNHFSPLTVPYFVSELVTIGARFHMKPLIPALSRSDVFYLLAFSRNQGCLYRIFRDKCELVENGSLEQGIHALHSVEEPVGKDGNPLEDRTEIYKHQFIEYARVVDELVRRALHDEKAPLILATVRENYDVYQKINRYPFLLQEYAFGNCDHKTPEQMKQEAVPLVQRHFDKKEELATKTLEVALQMGGLATNELETAIDASRQGRVDTCIVSADTSVWGRIETNGCSHVVRASDQDSSDLSRQDLLDYLAVRTIKSGGKVYVRPSDSIPGKSDLAVLFRY